MRKGISTKLAKVILTALLACLILPIAAFAQDTETPEVPASGEGVAAELPARFDLREKGVVGPVRNQNPWGACWAFATMAASETSILSEKGVTYGKDRLVLSPRHLAWFAGTALPDAAKMSAEPLLAPYASQAGEGMTIRVFEQNDFGSPFETGGFTFEAAGTMAAGVGPVLESAAPYQNEECMAQTNTLEPTGELEHGQTIDDFLAKHPGDYNGYCELDEEGDPGLPVNARKRVTQELIDAGNLAYYAARPDFDKSGHILAGNFSEDTPRYEWGLPIKQRFSRAYELEEYRALPEPTGGVAGQDYHYNPDATNAIKRELMAGRGVAISIFEDNVQEERDYAYYTNPRTWSQYTVDSDGTGKIQGAAHAVCIVGWDDEWGVDKFKSERIVADNGVEVNFAPPGPGAWIVRNSYGAEGQAFPNAGNVGYRDENDVHTGYFYLSYYDMSITRPASFDFDVSGHVSDFINQYDLMPAPVAYTEKSLGKRFANVFVADADQYVHALSVETDQPNTHARLELRRLGASDSLDEAELVTAVESDFEWGGFHRLALDERCLIRKGERFAVVGLLTTTGESGDVAYSIPVHRDVNESAIEKYGDSIDSYVTGVVNAGESFLEKDGAWVDWKDAIAEGKQNGALVSYYDYDNFSLKAYADDAGQGPSPQPESVGGEVGASYEVSGSTYKVTSNAENTVALARAKAAKTVAIPATVNIAGKAYKVTAIGAAAFARAKGKVTSVTIGKNVASIGKAAFAGCAKLAKVTGGASVKAIGARAFSGCKSLKKCSPASSKKLTKIGAFAFKGAKKLRAIIVMSSKLKKASIKSSLKGSSIATVKVKMGSSKSSKAYVQKYAKLFTKKTCGKKVRVKR